MTLIRNCIIVDDLANPDSEVKDEKSIQGKPNSG